MAATLNYCNRIISTQYNSTQLGEECYVMFLKRKLDDIINLVIHCLLVTITKHRIFKHNYKKIRKVYDSLLVMSHHVFLHIFLLIKVFPTQGCSSFAPPCFSFMWATRFFFCLNVEMHWSHLIFLFSTTFACFCWRWRFKSFWCL